MTDRDRSAVLEFKNRLLADPLCDRVMKIVLFGSHARGTVHDRSDLDILIIANKKNELTDLIADLTFEIQMKYRIGLEPVMFSLDELFPLKSYFLFNTMRYGQEVYSVSNAALKKEERKNLVNLSDEYLTGAEHSAKSEYWRLAVDAAYNAAELALKSLILKIDDDLPGSHGGLVGRFGELYIKTGLYEKALGRKLNQAMEKRNQARYKYSAEINQNDVKEAIELAKKLKGLAESELSA